MMPRHSDLSNCIRFLAADAVEQANSGHPGLPLGMADVATVLYQYFMRFDPQAPSWAGRDRFILSAGHGSMLLYALLYLTGYPDMNLEQLKRFRQLHSLTPGHPESHLTPGVETTTGPLGQGLANAVGIALGQQITSARLTPDLFDFYTYVIASDGDLMEGISHEAISLAGHLRLGRLIVFFDDNKITIDGATSLSVSDDQIARFQACGWHTQAIDGHDPAQIKTAIEAAQKDPRPSLISCRTIIAHGAPTKQGSHHAHGSPLGATEVQAMREALHWPHPPFEIPPPLLEAWRSFATRGQQAHAAWTKALKALPQNLQARTQRFLGKELPDLTPMLQALKQAFRAENFQGATRQSSGRTLEVLYPLLKEHVVAGSADLTPSNNTQVKAMQPIIADNYGGDYMHYGIREHGMAAVMNGLALSGFIPYGGTFLTFSDYCRPSIRLAALMQQQIIYVMTHDSIGLGEDGPTHQPIEHLAALRAMPHLLVLRPADAIEVAEAWEIALTSRNRPILLALSRQNTPLLRTGADTENKSRHGAYELSPADHPEAVVTLLATGTEVALALQVQTILQTTGVPTRVVSMPCWRLFDEQPLVYRTTTLQPDTMRIALEAGCETGWHKYIGDAGLFIGLDDFGASAPAKDVYKYFGLTAESVVHRIKEHLSVSL